MERRTTGGYIFIGTAVRFLMDTAEGDPVFGDARVLGNIESLWRYFAEYEFHVTARIANRLSGLVAGWKAELTSHSDDAEWASSRTLDADEVATIKRFAEIVRETLLAEASGKVAFIATDKRFTVEKLIDDIGSLMGSSVFASLPDIAQYDFEEGGKAVAFDLPTAAAFHFLRGTESALRDFYCRVVRRDRVPEPRMWGAMIAHMRGKRQAPSELLLGNLDSLRSHFRNPTQHPDKTYDSDEVQDLLSLAIDSLNRMAKHLEDRGL